MTYLLDTNIVSELRKPHAHVAVVAWRRSVPLHRIAIPGIVVAEAQAGIELTRRQNPAKAVELEAWLDSVVCYYTIIPADAAIFREWARLMHGKSPALGADAMVAATARIQQLAVVTHNVKDFKLFDVEVYNPFNYPRTEIE
jgi:toxin FitB